MKHHVHHDVATLVGDTWQQPTRGCHAASMHINFPSPPSLPTKLAQTLHYCTYLLTSRAPLFFLPSLPQRSGNFAKLLPRSIRRFHPSQNSSPTPPSHNSHIDCMLALLTYQICLLHRGVCACARGSQGWCARLGEVRRVFFGSIMLYALREVCVCGLAVLWWLLWWIGLSIGLEFMVPLCFGMCVCVYVCSCDGGRL